MGQPWWIDREQLEQDGPPQEAPTYQAMCVSFYPRRSGFSAFEQGSEIQALFPRFAVPLVWELRIGVPLRFAAGRLKAVFTLF